MSREPLFRLLLRLYPPEFRERHGEEMERLFAERRREVRGREGRGGETRLWAGTVADTVSTAGREWIERTRGGGGVDGWRADLRYSLRTLFRRPGFTAVTVLTIALGIGLNTAIFSVVRSVLLRPLPYDDPDEVVLVWAEMRNRDYDYFPTSPPDLADYQRMLTSFSHLGGVFTFTQPLTTDGEPEQIDVATVTDGFFQALAVEPAVGRGFTAEDFTPVPAPADGGPPPQVNGTVLLSHGIWQRRWGGDPSVVGRIVDIGGQPNVVAGVLPEGFRFLHPEEYAVVDDPDVWQAGRFDVANAPRNNVFLNLVARLAPGVSLETARAEVDRLAADFREQYEIRASSDTRMHVMPMQEEVTAHVRPVILALAGAVILVLLVACANVSNLLLVRAAGRRQELAVRAALGGGRWRLIRQTLMDGVVLAVLGGVAGVAIAVVGIDLLLALQPGNVPRLDDVGVDPTMLAFTAVAVIVVAMLVGVLPALQASRADVAEVLGERGRAGADTRSVAVRRFMVAGEVAVSLMLLVGAGLMVRSFETLQDVDPGFEPAGLVTFEAGLPFGRYPQLEDRLQANTRLRDELLAIPGVEAATFAFPMPLDGQNANIRWGPEASLEDPSLYQQGDVHFVGPGYFETLGTRVLAGRTFSDAEHADGSDVVVLDEILARRVFPEGDPVGKLFLTRVNGPDMEWRQVIGVVEHQRHHGLATTSGGAAFFTQTFLGVFGGTWAVRTANDPATLGADIRRVVASVDPLVPVAELEPMQAALDRATAPTRFALVLMGVFAVMAALLATLGLYGVLAHVVRQRTGEIGVRMAFGAPRDRILRLVVGEGMALSALGVAVGLVGALLLARVMEGMLVGVEPRDPLTYASVSVLFLVVAGFATAIPAWRASRVDPSRALRME